MIDKSKGLIQKYEVKKLTNPTKVMDCVVLEFDDEFARKGIVAYARACRAAGFVRLAADIDTKVKEYKSLAGEDGGTNKYAELKAMPGHKNFLKAEGSGKIYYKDPELGKFSTGETTILRAKAVVNERRGQVLHGKSIATVKREGKRITNPLISEIWDTEVLPPMKLISKKSTIAGYDKTWRVALEPYFKNKTVKFLNEERTLIDYKSWYIQKYPRRLAARTVMYLKILIKVCFDQKLILKLPNYKPIDDLVEFMDVKSNREEHRRVYEEVTEVRPLLHFSKFCSKYPYLSHRMHLAILLAARNGLRYGEIRTLKWTDINLKALSMEIIGSKNSTRRTNYMAEETLIVDTWRPDPDGRWTWIEVKTALPHQLEDHFAVRAILGGIEDYAGVLVSDEKTFTFKASEDFMEIATSENLKDILILKSCYMREVFIKQKTFTGNSEWVFPMPTNPKSHTSQQVLDKMWVRTKQMAKIDESREPAWFHDLRRTCATRLIESGTGYSDVSKMLDHDEKVLKDIYHVLTKQQKNNSERMSEFLSKQGETMNKKSSS